MLPYRFWDLYGTGCKTLRPIAVRLLAQCASTSPCEAQLVCVRLCAQQEAATAQQGVVKAQQLVYVFPEPASMSTSDMRLTVLPDRTRKVEPGADMLSDSDGDDDSSVRTTATVTD
jgi:hypothetical protein